MKNGGSDSKGWIEEGRTDAQNASFFVAAHRESSRGRRPLEIERFFFDSGPWHHSSTRFSSEIIKNNLSSKDAAHREEHAGATGSRLRGREPFGSRRFPEGVGFSGFRRGSIPPAGTRSGGSVTGAQEGGVGTWVSATPCNSWRVRGRKQRTEKTHRTLSPTCRFSMDTKDPSASSTVELPGKQVLESSDSTQ